MVRGVLVGLVAGVLCGLSRLRLAGPVDVYVNSIGAWILVPLTVGALTRSVPGAVLASLTQLAGFYLVTGAVGSVWSVLAWCACAVGAGLVFGGTGAWLSGRLRAGRTATRAAPRSRGRGP